MQLTIVTSDKRKMQLVFKAHIIEMGENILVDFRLSRVSGICLLQQIVLFLKFFNRRMCIIIDYISKLIISQLALAVC